MAEGAEEDVQCRNLAQMSGDWTLPHISSVVLVSLPNSNGNHSCSMASRALQYRATIGCNSWAAIFSKQSNRQQLKTWIVSGQNLKTSFLTYPHKYVANSSHFQQTIKPTVTKKMDFIRSKPENCYLFSLLPTHTS